MPTYVTPYNWGLKSTDLNGKNWIFGDSQSTTSFIRFTSQLPLLADEFGYTIVGHHLPGKEMSSVGNEIVEYADASYTSTELTPDTVWPATGDDAGVHHNQSREIDFISEPGNFVDLFSVQARESSFGDFDLSGPMAVRVILHNHSGSVNRISLEEMRGATPGANTPNNGNYGDGGSGTTIGGDLDWDETGDIRVIHKGVRGAASFGGGSELVGVLVQTSGSIEDTKQFRFLGAIIHQTGGTSATPDLTLPASGTMFATIAASGWSAYDHINRIDDIALDGLINAVEGFDTVILPLGQNTEDLGTDHANNMETLANRILTRHSTLGYSAPKIIMVAMWAYDSNHARMSSQADAVFKLTRANSWGFVNLHKTYNELDPATNGARFDGTPATYTMDALNLHPTNELTAQNIARDLFEHFVPANIVTVLETTRGVGRRRRAGRGRNRRIQ